MIIYSEFIVNLFTFGNPGIGSITLFPFIFIRSHYRTITDPEFQTKLAQLINHEKIHIRQYIELGVIFFYLFYILNWIMNIFLYKLFLEDMYQNIVFELEAYNNQDDPEYLKRRGFWAWRKSWKLRKK